ncbi:4'-phosphopantetheinyl transferase family protein [Microbacterium sp. LWH12-1.2]|uniref:4'-phosphopantetheinyl transferase family protein n=1 Tax=Microbacterium sp. LWH12-1.2 TaxID=3135259 RepID=UPI003444021C
MTVERSTIGPVRLAWTDVATRSGEAVAQFGESQQRRHKAMDPVRATRFATGRALLADVLSALTPLDGIRISSVCERCGGDHGRPRVLGDRFGVSVSYAGDMVVAAAARLDGISAIGVDIERVTSSEHTALADLTPLFAPHPPPTLRGWTLIEAALKADGRGLQVPPSDVRFEDVVPKVLPGGLAVRMPGRDAPVEVAPAPGPAGFVVSVAVMSAAAAPSP